MRVVLTGNSSFQMMLPMTMGEATETGGGLGKGTGGGGLAMDEVLA